MEFRTLARPTAKLLTPSTFTRGHKTVARTKRSLKIAPHDSFLPSRATAFPASDAIIYNPPSSEASPFHTPYIFLPKNDPRRAALTRLRHTAGSPAALPSSEAELPPAMRYKHRDPNYNLTVTDIQEMKKLRNGDPLTWSASALAKKFNCSEVFVRMAAPAPEAHLELLKNKEERREARWGPIRKAAREDRKRRTEMLYRGEL